VICEVPLWLAYDLLRRADLVVTHGGHGTYARAKEWIADGRHPGIRR
jgi:hypothetical protein